MMELTASEAVGPCEQCGSTNGVLLWTFDHPEAIRPIRYYLCVVCIALDIDDALGWKLHRVVVQGLANRLAGKMIQQTRKKLHEARSHDDARAPEPVERFDVGSPTDEKKV